MTEIEKTIITLIQGNQFLSHKLKQKYILSLFLMEDAKQVEYLRLIQGLSRRCEEIDNGLFVLRADEAGKLKSSFDEVKKDIMKKIQSRSDKKFGTNKNQNNKTNNEPSA